MSKLICFKLDNRRDNAQKLQEILTEHGCNIRTRIGLHPEVNNSCSANGIIILEVVDMAEELYEILSKQWKTFLITFD